MLELITKIKILKAIFQPKKHSMNDEPKPQSKPFQKPICGFWFFDVKKHKLFSFSLKVKDEKRNFFHPSK